MLLHCPFHVEEHPPRWFSIIMPALLSGLAITVSSCRLLAPIDPSALLQQARAVDPLIPSLLIPQFVLAPGTRPVVLPLALPPSFRLRARLLANSEALEQVRVAGYPLAFPSRSDDPASADGPEEPPLWRRISIMRDLGGLTVSVDGETLWFDGRQTQDESDGPQWLTITPAHKTTVTFQELIVTW
jgi:hypothetical protein